MLASTVKFSKYVRSRIKFPRLPDLPYGANLVVRGGMRSKKPNPNGLIPQDPTVCLIQQTHPHEVPLPHPKKAEEVLTQFTFIKPSNRQSTSELRPHPHVR